MSPCFEIRTAILQIASFELLLNDLQSGIMVALGAASFIVGTVLRRTEYRTKELANSQPYGPWEKRVALESSHGIMSSSAEAAVPGSNPNAAETVVGLP
jgi:hypothetical protein